MPIKIKSIEYTESGVNIIGDEIEIVTLQDGSTREIKLRGYAAPMGLKDFGDDPEFAKQEIEKHVAKVVGNAAAKPIAENVVLQAELIKERQAKEQIIAERDAERAEKLVLRQERDQQRGGRN